MEHKGILWIVAAVGIFLLAVLGGALILYAPAKETNTVVTSIEPTTWNQKTTKPQTLITEPQNNTSKAETQTELNSENNSVTTKDLTVYATNTTVVTKDGTTLMDTRTDSATKPVTQIPNVAVSTVIDLSTKNETTIPTTNKTNFPLNTTSIQPTKKTEVTQKETSPVAKKVTTTITKKTTPVAKTTTKKAVSVKEADSFWVQAASYSNKINADKARDTLLAEEIPGEVFTYTSSNGFTYYRLRVGPYTTKSEAEYWNKRISLVDDFAQTQSYVTNSAIPTSK